MVNNAVSIVVKNAALIGVVGENLVINHTTSQGKLLTFQKISFQNLFILCFFETTSTCQVVRAYFLIKVLIFPTLRTVTGVEE